MVNDDFAEVSYRDFFDDRPRAVLLGMGSVHGGFPPGGEDVGYTHDVPFLSILQALLAKVERIIRAIVCQTAVQIELSEQSNYCI